MRIDSSYVNIKALIVDDSKTALLDLRTKLTSFLPSENIYLAQDYWQAVKLLESHNFNVAFIDLYMPEKTGMDLIVDFIYADKRTEKLPVVVTTGINPESLVTHSLQKNTYRYLFKPIEIAEIEEALLNLPKP